MKVMQINESLAIISKLRSIENGKLWCTHFALDGRDDIELVILNVNGSPCPQRKSHAVQCLQNIHILKREMVDILTEYPYLHPMFPPREKRIWSFEGLEFTDDNPNMGAGFFIVDEQEWEYLYVAFYVHFENGRVTGVSANSC